MKFQPEIRHHRQISGADISYQYLSTGEVLKLLKQQKPYEWIKGLYEQKSYTVSENTGYNRTQLQEQLKTLSCAQAENQTEPEMHMLHIRTDSL